MLLNEGYHDSSQYEVGQDQGARSKALAGGQRRLRNGLLPGAGAGAIGRSLDRAGWPLAPVGWIGASRGSSLAVPVLWEATQLYGTFGSLVLFLIWAYVMTWVLLLGGLLLVSPGRHRGPSDS
jgi:hypothetical protein